MLKKVLHKHAPLQSRIIRGNQAPFMNKELSKAVMRRSQLKTKYIKTKQKADRNAYKSSKISVLNSDGKLSSTIL